jgi:hypothetical protein
MVQNKKTYGLVLLQSRMIILKPFSFFVKGVLDSFETMASKFRNSRKMCKYIYHFMYNYRGFMDYPKFT